MNEGSSGWTNSRARLEAFSDGVFAIAVTLLELKVPHLATGAPEPTAEALRDTMASNGPAT